ncbi:type II secretion system protein GspM [Reinekea blandensis]|uniref:General secretion pathway protein M n=1 Tax=Reinekea blandensis MED297 TaxID=314283 RepID=A4BDW7_9GAMM|nr:type II secretion system protein M [Reinekea blandensis]EAR09726.1 general secretion pathway protein M [Reinekea blandensis MED297]
MFETYLEPLREKWLSLSRRDQQAARLLGISLLIAIIVFGLIVPLASWRQDLQRELANAQQTLQELTALAPQAMAVTGGATELNPSIMNSEIRRQAARYGIEIQRFEPDGELLRVWLDDARYPSVVQWLGGLENMGIGHTELALDDRPNPGFVNVRVTFGVGG